MSRKKIAATSQKRQLTQTKSIQKLLSKMQAAQRSPIKKTFLQEMTSGKRLGALSLLGLTTVAASTMIRQRQQRAQGGKVTATASPTENKRVVS